MSSRSAGIGTVVFFFAAPVTVGVVVPALLSGGWQADSAPPLAISVAGVALALAGLAAVILCFARFVTEGRGTPAPLAPTGALVIGGMYRHVRNPMYVAVIALIAGQAIALASPVLAAYAVVFAATVATFVRLYEEPTLAEQFGVAYERYRAAVPGWIPRRRPWSG
jgi:protein-S-isoprenylcysteine O-methyltransferase Ste14